MASALAELLKDASAPISRTPRRLRDAPVTIHKDRMLELETLLHLRDGFRALDNALVVRPSIDVGSVRCIDEWNQFSSWRKPYAHVTELYFFADTVGGRQFGLHKDEILSFDPHTGAVEHVAFKLERWAQRVAQEPALVQRPLAVKWQAEHRPLISHERLASPTAPAKPVIAEDDETAPIVEPSPAPETYVAREDLDLMRRWAKLFVLQAKGTDDEPADTSFWSVDPE